MLLDLQHALQGCSGLIGHVLWHINLGAVRLQTFDHLFQIVDFHIRTNQILRGKMEFLVRTVHSQLVTGSILCADDKFLQSDSLQYLMIAVVLPTKSPSFTTSGRHSG